MKGDFADLWKAAPGSSVRFTRWGYYAANSDQKATLPPEPRADGDGFTEWIYRNRVPVYITDVDGAEKFNVYLWDDFNEVWEALQKQVPQKVHNILGQFGAKSELGIPIFDQQKDCIGVAWIKYKEAKRQELTPEAFWVAEANWVMQEIRGRGETKRVPAPPREGASRSWPDARNPFPRRRRRPTPRRRRPRPTCVNASWPTSRSSRFPCAPTNLIPARRDWCAPDAMACRTKTSSTCSSPIPARRDNQRRERRIARRIRNAGFRELRLLSAFDWEFNKQAIDRAQIEELATGAFIGRKNNLIFVGQTGVGKSFLVQAIGGAACALDYSVRYITSADPGAPGT